MSACTAATCRAVSFSSAKAEVSILGIIIKACAGTDSSCASAPSLDIAALGVEVAGAVAARLLLVAALGFVGFRCSPVERMSSRRWSWDTCLDCCCIWIAVLRMAWMWFDTSPVKVLMAASSCRFSYEPRSSSTGRGTEALGAALVVAAAANASAPASVSAGMERR